MRTIKTVDARTQSIRIGTPFVQSGDRGNCPHRPIYDWLAAWRPDPQRENHVFLVSQWCVKCRDYISQGPSNDTEPTSVEVRAAEIAAEITDRGGCEMTTLEMWGFNEKTPRLRGGGTILIDTASQRAGRLAKAIVTHGEGRP